MLDLNFNIPQSKTPVNTITSYDLDNEPDFCEGDNVMWGTQKATVDRVNKKTLWLTLTPSFEKVKSVPIDEVRWVSRQTSLLDYAKKSKTLLDKAQEWKAVREKEDLKSSLTTEKPDFVTFDLTPDIEGDDLDPDLKRVIDEGLKQAFDILEDPERLKLIREKSKKESSLTDEEDFKRIIREKENSLTIGKLVKDSRKKRLGIIEEIKESCSPWTHFVKWQDEEEAEPCRTNWLELHPLQIGVEVEDPDSPLSITGQISAIDLDYVPWSFKVIWSEGEPEGDWYSEEKLAVVSRDIIYCVPAPNTNKKGDIIQRDGIIGLIEEVDQVQGRYKVAWMTGGIEWLTFQQLAAEPKKPCPVLRHGEDYVEYINSLPVPEQVREKEDKENSLTKSEGHCFQKASARQIEILELLLHQFKPGDEIRPYEVFPERNAQDRGKRKIIDNLRKECLLEQHPEHSNGNVYCLPKDLKKEYEIFCEVFREKDDKNCSLKETLYAAEPVREQVDKENSLNNCSHKWDIPWQTPRFLKSPKKRCACCGENQLLTLNDESIIQEQIDKIKALASNRTHYEDDQIRCFEKRINKLMELIGQPCIELLPKTQWQAGKDVYLADGRKIRILEVYKRRAAVWDYKNEHFTVSLAELRGLSLTEDKEAGLPVREKIDNNSSLTDTDKNEKQPFTFTIQDFKRNAANWTPEQIEEALNYLNQRQSERQASPKACPVLRHGVDETSTLDREKLVDSEPQPVREKPDNVVSLNGVRAKKTGVSQVYVEEKYIARTNKQGQKAYSGPYYCLRRKKPTEGQKKQEYLGKNIPPKYQNLRLYHSKLAA